MGKLTKDEIRERIRYVHLTIGSSLSNFFANDVARRVKRYIVAIVIYGDGVASRTVEIEKVKQDGTYEMIFDNVPVSPAGEVWIPPTYDIENPIIMLEGGTNLAAVASAAGPEATVIYWDDEAG
jgi:hypothetical protein